MNTPEQQPQERRYTIDELEKLIDPFILAVCGKSSEGYNYRQILNEQIDWLRSQEAACKVQELINRSDLTK